MTQPIPEGYHTVTPMFMFKDCRRAIDFYKRAFAAEEMCVMPGPDGRNVMHAQLRIGSSIIMMADENPQCECKSAERLGASPISFYLYLQNVDTAFDIAVSAGAKVMMPVGEMFWGDRAGTVQDPFGYTWTLASHTRDLSMEQIEEGAQAACAQMAEKKS